jgi:hypothetical protein
MNLLTLSVKGADEALISLQKAFPIAVESTWRKGDRRRNGALWEVSGFSATIADAASPVELIDALRDFLAECSSRGIVLGERGLEAQVSVGVTVGEAKQYVACIDLPRALLAALAACGVSLAFSAYPTSDGANEAGSI